MKTTEEKLWNYIDGSCTPEEQQAIALLIKQDEAWRIKYNELLLLNSEMAAMDLDEPPMAFIYNVMETIRNEYAQTPLKSKVNMRIINGIGLFFVLTIAAILGLLLVQAGHAAVSSSASAPVKFSLPGFSPGKTFIQGFLFFDVVLILYLVDNYLRKKRLVKTDISVQHGGQQSER